MLRPFRASVPIPGGHSQVARLFLSSSSTSLLRVLCELCTTNRQIRCAPRKNVILCANTSQYRLACLLVAALPRCVQHFSAGPKNTRTICGYFRDTTLATVNSTSEIQWGNTEQVRASIACEKLKTNNQLQTPFCDLN